MSWTPRARRRWRRSALARSSSPPATATWRSEEHTSELQSLRHLVCRLLLEKKKKSTNRVESLIENTNHSMQQQVTEIMSQMLTQAQSTCQLYTYETLNKTIITIIYKIKSC